MNRWLHFLALTTAGMTVVLLCAGALVTGTGSGLAVPDWPLSFGQFFPPMVGGVLYEHGHRMVAGSVLILTLLLSVALINTERRGWVRALGIFALALVIVQACLGGVTVLMRLPIAVSVAHACTAQIFLSVTVVIAMVTSPRWDSKLERHVSTRSLRILSGLVSLLFFVQILLGAVVRHIGAGLAIPDFPLAFGSLWPHFISYDITINYMHRLGAFAMVALTIWLVTKIYLQYFHRLDLVALVGILVSLLTMQFILGALTVLLKRPIPITTAHLVVGGLCFASSVALTVRIFFISQNDSVEAPNFSPGLSGT